jgi:hypothetical protein
MTNRDAKPNDPEWVAEAKAMWGEGRTGGDIAFELTAKFAITITRNQVLGLQNRRKWPGEHTHGFGHMNVRGRPATKGPNAPPKKPPATRGNFNPTIRPKGATEAAKPREPTTAEVHRSMSIDHGAKSLLDLAWNECRWPVTETTPFLHCARPRRDDPNDFYCPFHRFASVAGLAAAHHRFKIPLGTTPGSPTDGQATAENRSEQVTPQTAHQG